MGTRVEQYLVEVIPGEAGGGTEGGRERGKERERQREGQRERQRETERDRQRERERESNLKIITSFIKCTGFFFFSGDCFGAGDLSAATML